MKRILLFICAFCILMLNGCSNVSNENVEFKNDYGYSHDDNYTYRFTGSSEHFAFETGKVYYGENNKKSLLIKNFKLVNKLKNYNDVSSYSINLKFKNISLLTNEMTPLKKSNLSHELEKYFIEENFDGGELYESDAFLQSTANTFKKDMKIEIKYCYNNGICKTENLDINYID